VGLSLRLEAYINCNMTVTMKAKPQPMAANRIRVLSIRILLEYSCDEVRSSDVIRRIIAVAAIHKLMSVSVRGMFISITIAYCSQAKNKASSYD
jgi:hypothetical protein